MGQRSVCDVAGKKAKKGYEEIRRLRRLKGYEGIEGNPKSERKIQSKPKEQSPKRVHFGILALILALKFGFGF
jgi:hypothetical protein